MKYLILLFLINVLQVKRFVRGTNKIKWTPNQIEVNIQTSMEFFQDVSQKLNLVRYFQEIEKMTQREPPPTDMDWET